MDILQLINAIVICVGMPTGVGAMIMIGRKLKILAHLQEQMEDILVKMDEVKERLVKINSHL